MTTKHVRQVHEHLDGDENCSYCQGSLFTCSVCGASEGELTTDCPGRRTTQEERDAAMAGTLNFRDGEWRQESN